MKVIVLKQGIHDDVPGLPEGVFGCTEICGAVVLLKAETSEEENIIVDTGNLGYEEEIIDALGKEGLKPEDITTILMTHSHLDHLSNNYLFKNAKRMIGKGKWDNDKTLEMFDIENPKVKGVKIISTPGHFPKHASIVVESKGKTYVISGDAIQEECILTGKFVFPPNQDYIDSAKKIVDIADVIIPGHGRIIQGKDLEELKKVVYKMEEIK